MSTNKNMYVGRNINEVKEELKESGQKYRITSQDDQDYMITMDYDIARYKFSVKNEIITSVKMG